MQNGKIFFVSLESKLDFACVEFQNIDLHKITAT